MLTEEAIKELYQYDWPGNIRQLENAIEYIVSISKKDKKVEKSDLPDYILNYTQNKETPYWRTY